MGSKAPDIEHVKAYYDAQVVKKLKGFVDGNLRVERAWHTIVERTLVRPTRVLEIGCGIGQIAWRMARVWPGAEVIGVDISERSIDTARALFHAPRLVFVAGPFPSRIVSGQFDLIVLMDVYEHVAPDARSELHELLKDLRAPGGRIILTFPTPRHQGYLRRELPHTLQPVDEDIDLLTICELARGTGSEVILYEQVSVWHRGDYAHVVLGCDPWLSVPPQRPSWRHRLMYIVSRVAERRVMQSRSKRLALIRSRLGNEVADAVK